MKKAFVTGITGTVAPYVKEELERNQFTVFDRHFRINNEQDLIELKKYLDEIRPNYIFHLALGPYSYVETLAKYTKKNKIQFVYISTVSVFEDNHGGPYTKETKVLATNEYGKYKYECERIAIQKNPDSYICRIGWQISEKGDSETNNMFQFIKNNTNGNSEITVSSGFYPSTSFLNDTAKAIVDTVLNNEPDLYLINSNEDKSLYEIVNSLNKQFNLDIKVIEDTSFNRNDVMIDERVKIKKR